MKTTIKAWAARDGDGSVWLYSMEPEYVRLSWGDYVWDTKEGYTIQGRQFFPKSKFGLKPGQCKRVTITVEDSE